MLVQEQETHTPSLLGKETGGFPVSILAFHNEEEQCYFSLRRLTTEGQFEGEFENKPFP